LFPTLCKVVWIFFCKILRLSQSSISIISHNIQLCPKTEKGKMKKLETQNWKSREKEIGN
jgi:hypothetical protein